MLQRDPEPGDGSEGQSVSYDAVILLQLWEFVVTDAADQQLQLVLVKQGLLKTKKQQFVNINLLLINF